MAEKKTKKVEKAKIKQKEAVKPNFSAAERLFLDNSNAIKILKSSIESLEQRLDRIVAALDKSKSVRGL